MSDNENVLTVTDETFGAEIEGAEGLALVDFWAVWCGPCRFVQPIIEELAEEYRDSGVKVAKMDVDQNLSVPARFGVRSIPTVLFFKDGQVVDTIVGAVPKPIFEGKIQQHIETVSGEARQQG
jgi:thioredoxin 1